MMQQLQTADIINAIVFKLIQKGISPEQAGNLQWTFDKPSIGKDGLVEMHHLVFDAYTDPQVIKQLNINPGNMRFDLQVEADLQELEFCDFEDICLAFLTQPGAVVQSAA